jgi:hypothetical protein
MQNEVDVLRDVSRRLESVEIRFMLTGSMAMNYYAQPRMTRDIDIVVELALSDVAKVVQLFTPDYYVSPEAVTQSILRHSMFNLIHQESVIKVDFVVRKDEPFRLAEFQRRVRIRVEDFETWIVTKEDLILSKLYWARDSHSERQLSDIKNLIATGCDLAYLEPWTQRLGLESLWNEVSAG